MITRRRFSDLHKNTENALSKKQYRCFGICKAGKFGCARRIPLITFLNKMFTSGKGHVETQQPT